MHNAKKIFADDLSNIPLGAFISIIHRTHMIYLNDKVKELDLTAGQIPFLMELSHNEGITQEYMANHFHIDKGTVARALRKLEDNEFLYREIDLENRRRYLIYLTKKGKDVIPQIINIDKEWEDLVRSKFSDNENIRLLEILQKLAINSLEKVHKHGENNNGK